MVKIFMLINSLAGGGAERVASELSLHLNSHYERQIVTLTNVVTYPSNEPPISLNIKKNKNPKYLYLLLGFVTGIIKYRRLLKKHSPDISMSFLVLDNFINIITTSNRRDVKTIVQVHTSLSKKFSESIWFPLIRILIEFMYKKADSIVVVSNGVKTELIDIFKIRPDLITVIYNPVNISQIEELASEKVENEWFSENVPIILNMGRLTKAKGQWHLIRAFAKIRLNTPCKLVIIGSGELENYLMDVVEKLDLHEEVKFLGWQENPYKYISKSSIFILSSLWEALPYALIEAMACGTPVISTNCKYGPEEILECGKRGILIPVFDEKFNSASDPLSLEEEILVKKTLDLLREKSLREYYSRSGKERAYTFNIKNSILKYEELFEIMINKKA